MDEIQKEMIAKIVNTFAQKAKKGNEPVEPHLKEI